MFAYTAFQELNTTRSIGFGIGAIPWTAINDYASRYGVTGIDLFDAFTLFVRALDDAWLEHVAKPKGS